jgi:hypothetical protein
MRKLQFTTLEELYTFCEKEQVYYMDSVCSAIENSLQKKESTAIIYTIEIGDDSLGDSYEIFLEQNEFIPAVKTAMKWYSSNNKPDEAINAWELLKILQNDQAD